MKYHLAYILLCAAQVNGYVAPSISTKQSASPTFLSATATVQLTRFDRLKQKYKGVINELVDVADLPFSYEDFDAAVQATEYSFNRNDVVKGTLVQYDKQGAIIDIGAKASAFLPPGEMSLIPTDGETVETLLQLESEYEVMIISEEDENGQLLVSIKRIQYAQAWAKVLEMQTSD